MAEMGIESYTLKALVLYSYTIVHFTGNSIEFRRYQTISVVTRMLGAGIGIGIQFCVAIFQWKHSASQLHE